MRRLLYILPALAFVTACSGTPVVAEKTVEKEVSTQLTQMAGQAPDKIDCPGDLEGKVGNKMRCTLTAGADELGLTVKVTKVEGTKVDFDIQVDEK